MIRALVVDDHPLFRDGLTGLLQTVDGIEVVDSAGDGETAVRRTLELGPDVVLMDLNLPGTSGLEATRRIVAGAPETAVLVLTMVDDDDSVMAALRVGARGYLLKGAVQEEVLAAVRTVAAGGAVFGPGAAARVLRGSNPRAPSESMSRQSRTTSHTYSRSSRSETAPRPHYASADFSSARTKPRPRSSTNAVNTADPDVRPRT